jgi:uncharacterized protein YjbI with pentapeptide repeats
MASKPGLPAAVPTLAALAWAPYLEPLENQLEREVRYESVQLDQRTLEEVDCDRSRFFECAFTGLTIEGGNFRQVQLRDVWMEATRWISGNLAGDDWLDVQLVSTLLAGVQMFDAKLRRVTFRECKLDSVNLRGAKLLDIRFLDCQLEHVDFGGASLTNVDFPGSRISGAAFDRAELKNVDFRAATELRLDGSYDALRGSTITSAQLIDLAPALAQALGIVVRDD